MFPAKFSHIEDGEHISHDYGNIYFEQPCGPTTCLVIGPSQGHVDLMIEMVAELLGDPWLVLYVLLVPRRGNRESGRYQSQPFETHAELAAFLSAFRSFFEDDGRHQVWVGSAVNHGVLAYDQHDVIFAYGPLDRFIAILKSRGFGENKFWFPAPHTHSFAEEYDAEEERLMNEIEWQYSPLQAGDEW
jgi:hypothetical protein